MLEDAGKKAIDRLLPMLTKKEIKAGPSLSESLFYSIHECCSCFYTSKYEYWEGSAGGKDRLLSEKNEEPKLLSDMLLPVAGTNEPFSDLTLKKLLLISNFSVVVLPINYSITWLSYSDPYRPRLGDLAQSQCIALNAKYSSLLKSYQLIFLPSFTREYDETLSGNSTTTYVAPFKQDADNVSYMPYNSVSIDSTTDVNLVNNLGIFHKIDIPYFPDLSLDDLVRIKLNETEAFPRFQYFLKKKIKEMAIAEKPLSFKEVAEEIEYEIHRLHIEAEKLSKLRLMRGVSIGTFAVSLGAMFVSSLPGLPSGAPGLREIAGIIGTTTLYNIIREYFENRSKIIDLKKDNFYIPFLFEEAVRNAQKATLGVRSRKN